MRTIILLTAFRARATKIPCTFACPFIDIFIAPFLAVLRNDGVCQHQQGDDNNYLATCHFARSMLNNAEIIFKKNSRAESLDF